MTYYFFYIVFKRKRLIISLTILGIALTALGTYLCTPLYKGTSKIMAHSNVSQEVILFNDLYQQVPKSTNVVPANNFIEVAESQSLARVVVDKFQLDKKKQRKLEEPEDFREYFWSYLRILEDGIKDAVKYPYNLYKQWTTGIYPQKSGPDYRTEAIEEFLEDMTDIDWVSESDIINLTIWAESPADAEGIAKEMTDLVIQKSIALEQNAAGYGYDFSKGEVAKAQGELTSAEQALHQFKQKWNVSKLEKQKEIKLDELDEVERNLISINAELSAKKAKMEEGERQLKEQKRLLTSLNSYESLLDENVSLSVDINALMAKKKEYESAKAQITSELGELVQREKELTQLERTATLKEQLFTQLSSKHDKLAVQRVSNLSGFDLRVIDSPEISENAESDWPYWDLNLEIGIPASILVAIGFAFLLELRNESFWIGEQIEKRLNIPLLGTIHEVKNLK
ncbi:MAG: Wzz/FepE/Etk N-terminal domain-containing protein [Thermodesulfobacteriota bacterium]